MIFIFHHFQYGSTFPHIQKKKKIIITRLTFFTLYNIFVKKLFFTILNQSFLYFYSSSKSTMLIGS